jgi:hypothetical protein
MAALARLGFGGFTAVNQPNADYQGSAISIPVSDPVGATVNTLKIPEITLTLNPAATVVTIATENGLDTGAKTSITIGFSGEASFLA